MNSRFLIAASTFVLGATAVFAYRVVSPTKHSTHATLATADDHFLVSGGASLRYREVGHGEPVVLLHDYGEALESWSPLADSLARDFRVIVPDLRGFGQSSTPDGASEYGRHWVEDIVRLLRHVGVPAAHIVGHSLGGAVALNLALDRPAQVTSLTLVAPALWHDSLDAADVTRPHLQRLRDGDGLTSVTRWLSPELPERDRIRRAHVLMKQNDADALISTLESLPSLMVPGRRMLQSQIPAVALTSISDPLMHGAHFVAGYWPHLRLVELPTYDHTSITRAPELLTEFRRLAAATGTPWP